MVLTTVNFEKDNVQPPVFVAGSFTDWQPIEMTHETTESNGSVKNVFSHKVELSPGDYQYKFRLGPGDWWVLDESTPTATDESGNVNNVLLVEPQESKPSTEPSIETIPTPPTHIPDTRDAHIIEDEPKPNGSADHEESARQNPPPEEVVTTLTDSDTERIDDNTESPKPDSEKQVQFDEHTGKITAEIVSNRKHSIPDFAPPPYSLSVNGTATDTSDETQVAPVAEAPPQTQSIEPVPAKAQPEKKQQSFVAQIYSERGLVVVIAIVLVPVAVSYYLRR